MASGYCNRRSFLAGTVLVPTAALTAASQEEKRREPPKPAKGVKITVLKRTLQKEFQKYVKGGVMPICSAVREGQEFVAQPPYSKCPDGMCAPAWGHMRESAKFVDGGSVDTLVVCCTDGYRPVFFLLERVI